MMIAGVMLAALLAAGPARAQPGCSPADIAKLRLELRHGDPAAAGALTRCEQEQAHRELVEKLRDIRGPVGWALAILAVPCIALAWALISSSIGTCAIARRSLAIGGPLHEAGSFLKDEKRLGWLLILAGPALGAFFLIFLLAVIRSPGAQSVRSGADLSAVALRALLQPQVVIAYFAAGYALLFVDSAIVACILERAQGRAHGLWVGIRQAARRAPDLLILTLVVFGGLWTLERAWSWLKNNLGVGLDVTLLGDLGVLGSEIGLVTAGMLALTVMAGEDVGLGEACRRGARFIRDEESAILGPMTAIGFLQGGNVLALLALPAFGGFFASMPMLVFAVAGDYLGFIKNVDDTRLFFAVFIAPPLAGAGIGVFAASFYISALFAVAAVFCAGAYLQARRGAALAAAPSAARLPA